MVNFRSPAAEIGLPVCGTPVNFNGFRVLAALLHGSQVEREPNFAPLNGGRHLCSAGRPSGWALAHISSLYIIFIFSSKFMLNFPQSLQFSIGTRATVRSSTILLS